MSHVVEILVSNERDYYEGKDKGVWLKLPMDENLLKEEIKKFKVEGFSLIVPDFIFTDPEQAFEISTFCNIEELNYLLSKYELNILTALMDYYSSIEEVKEMLDENQIIWFSDVESLEDLADIMIQGGSISGIKPQVPTELMPLLSLRQVAMHLEHNVGWKANRKSKVCFLKKRKY